MPPSPQTAAYIKSLERDTKRLSATIRYHQRKSNRTIDTLNNLIVSLYEENKALSGEKKSAAHAKPSQPTKVATPPKFHPVAKSRWHLKPEDRRPYLSPTEILIRPGNPPLFGSAINEYGTNVGSELFL